MEGTVCRRLTTAEGLTSTRGDDIARTIVVTQNARNEFSCKSVKLDGCFGGGRGVFFSGRRGLFCQWGVLVPHHP